MELTITNKKGKKFVVLYDECDHELISRYKWYIRQGYVGSTNRNAVKMHRLLLGLTDSKIEADHKNHNKCDNRRENIRIATHQENCCNRKPKGKSKYLGVYTIVNYGRNNNGKRYEYIVAQIKIDGKNTRIGTFRTEEDAAIAYDKSAREIFGEFAYLNFPELLKTALCQSL